MTDEGRLIRAIVAFRGPPPCIKVSRHGGDIASGLDYYYYYY